MSESYEYWSHATMCYIFPLFVLPELQFPYFGLQLEDEGEKFERLHEQLLMEDPDSVAFQNARMRTDRRKTYEMAMSQTQPSQTRKPGTPTKIMTNKPPAKMEIQIR